MGNITADITVGTLTIRFCMRRALGFASYVCARGDDVVRPAAARFEPTRPALNRPPLTLRFARSLFCRASRAALGNEHGITDIR